MKVVNLVSVFIREYKGPKQAFSITFRKFTESTNNKTIFRQYNIFYKLIFFFNLCSALISIIAKKLIKSRTMQSGLRAVALHSLRAIAVLPRYFRKPKKFGVLRPKLPNYVISCDYGQPDQKEDYFMGEQTKHLDRPPIENFP